MTDVPEHRLYDAHPHVHDRFCGHPVVPHEDHTGFLHAGRVHCPHGNHIDDAGAAAADVHVTHVGHMHVHGPGCGHAAVAHAGHVDFVHGEHRHVAHAAHYDEH